MRSLREFDGWLLAASICYFAAVPLLVWHPTLPIGLYLLGLGTGLTRPTFRLPGRRGEPWRERVKH